MKNMKQNINEIKKMQRIAGLITESEYQETIMTEEQYYVVDEEGEEEPIGPFSLKQAKAEVAKQGPGWKMIDAKTAKQIWSHLEDEKPSTKDKNINKILTSGGFDPIDDEELLDKASKILSLIGGNPSAKAVNALVMVIEDAEGGDISWD